MVQFSEANLNSAKEAEEIVFSNDASGFVLLEEIVPDAAEEIRYSGEFNFVGERIDGYEEPLALLTREAASALRRVSDELLPQGYRLKIYDAYRPYTAVLHFMRWASEPENTGMQEVFYPQLEKQALFDRGYISDRSAHCRGSTVDLTLVDGMTGEELDMGGIFDYFGLRSRSDYTGLTQEQYKNRMRLQSVMMRHGFIPICEEWWHFTLAQEPYPNTYFTFPVRREVLK